MHLNEIASSFRLAITIVWARIIVSALQPRVTRVEMHRGGSKS